MIFLKIFHSRFILRFLLNFNKFNKKKLATFELCVCIKIKAFREILGVYFSVVKSKKISFSFFPDNIIEFKEFRKYTEKERKKGDKYRIHKHIMYQLKTRRAINARLIANCAIKLILVSLALSVASVCGQFENASSTLPIKTYQSSFYLDFASYVFNPGAKDPQPVNFD